MMTAEENKQLQDLFRYAAETLPARLFTGCKLEWKPGFIGQTTQMIKAAKRAAEDELGRLSGAAPATPARTGGWTAAKPSAAAPRSGMAIGGHRTKSGSVAADLKTAMMKANAHGDALALLQEGASIGADMAVEAVAGDLKDEAVRTVAEIVRSSGVLDPLLAVGAEEIATEVAGALPLIGAATNLGSGFINGVRALGKWWSSHKLGKESVFITPGNPQAALRAVQTLFDRKRNEYATYAAMDTAAGGAQLGAAFADLGAVSGPLIGLGKAAAKLSVSISIAALNFHEFRKGQKLLIQPERFTVASLPKCPILGTYLLTEAETSTLLAFLTAGPLPENWMLQVEELKPHVDTVIRLANQCQLEAPVMLRGLRTAYKAPVGAEFKGAHMLDFRLRKAVTRISHEARMVLKRDPRGLRFLARHVAAKFGLG